jgi:hypothetical protein
MSSIKASHFTVAISIFYLFIFNVASSGATISKEIRLQSATTYVATTEPAALCDLITALPGLATLSSNPWNCQTAQQSLGSWCTWKGVTCLYATTPTIISYIDLTGFNVKGTLPSSLGTLTKLDGLYVAQNSLSGTLPSALGGMSSLTALDVSSNSLSGTVPSTYLSLTNLVVLNVNYNYMTGTLPSYFAANTYNDDSYNAVYSTYVQKTHGPTARPTQVPTRAPTTSKF